MTESDQTPPQNVNVEAAETVQATTVDAPEEQGDAEGDTPAVDDAQQG